MAARTFEDSAGARWEVFEVRRTSTKPGVVSAGLEQGWLAFSRGDERRRLAPVPAGWELAAEPELARLCAEARAVRLPQLDAHLAPPPQSVSVAEHAVPVTGLNATGTTTGVLPADSPPPPAAPLVSPMPLAAHLAHVSHLAAASHAPADVAHPVDLAAVEGAVRAFAHAARTSGIPVVDAMVQLKALLTDRFPGGQQLERGSRLVRHWFVEAYYFERDA